MLERSEFLFDAVSGAFVPFHFAQFSSVRGNEAAVFQHNDKCLQYVSCLCSVAAFPLCFAVLKVSFVTSPAIKVEM